MKTSTNKFKSRALAHKISQFILIFNNCIFIYPTRVQYDPKDMTSELLKMIKAWFLSYMNFASKQGARFVPTVIAADILV